MRVAVIGAGPGGLYAALLLKRADPANEIAVYEQNPEGATYGWGVVFSDTTLAAFREADHPTYEAITDRFVFWDAIDIRYRDELIRAEGQPFAGIRRTTLLRILADRCRELDVDLRFEHPVEDHGPLAEDHDLVVAADGVHSPVREAHADHFGTRLDEGAARYIWFGTPLPLDSFTFVFRENRDGLFQAHAYPFDGETSTWIVECREDAWREAGLDRADEKESIAYCEELFAPELRGRPLLSNDSRWISFVTVTNRTWRRGRVVLLGDAAHTAHFSIGSGTKLAMEDAIALANGVETRPDLDAALRDYEAERRPRVERFQEAARRSQSYFEDIPRYAGMEPRQFAFHLLTRSGRVDYTSLRMRDPRLVERVDAMFDGEASRLAPPPLFHPLSLRGITLDNRVAARPAPRYGADEGTPAGGAVADLLDAGRSGAGLVLAGPVAVAPAARITPGDEGCWSGDHEEAWAGAVAALRAEGRARVGLVLSHAGPRGSTRPRGEGTDRSLREGGWSLVAASPQPYGPGLPAPREADRADMDEVIGRFVESADLARRAGIDLLLVHMGHGYLLASFISPLTNHREDRYGGDLESRMRFPLEVFDAVRAAWPKERPLGAVVTADDLAPGGAGPDQAAEVSGMLRDGGCDLILPVAGQTTWRTLPAYGPAYLAEHADRIRNERGVPTLLEGGITTLDQVNTLVAGGRADLCVLGPPA